MTNTTGILDGYARIEEIAEDLELHPATLRRWTKRSDGLPFLRIGRSIYLHIAGTREWLERRTQRPSQAERRGPGRPRKVQVPTVTDHLTDAGTELGRLAAKTPAGMAYFVQTGPAGTTCGGCKFFMGTIGQEAGRCREYVRMMRAKGFASVPEYELPPATPSCRHFEAKA